MKYCLLTIDAVLSVAVALSVFACVIYASYRMIIAPAWSESVLWFGAGGGLWSIINNEIERMKRKTGMKVSQ